MNIKNPYVEEKAKQLNPQNLSFKDITSEDSKSKFQNIAEYFKTSFKNCPNKFLFINIIARDAIKNRAHSVFILLEKIPEKITEQIPERIQIYYYDPNGWANRENIENYIYIIILKP